MADCSEDFLIALRLEAEFALEDANSDVASLIPPQFRKGSPLKQPGPSSPRPSTSKGFDNSPTIGKGLSIIAPEWEDLDPTPDLQAMFLQFNAKFFWGKLAACEVRWSPRMTVCAGLCSYSPRQGFCSIRLSVPLLKLRPRKDFVETLLHEMIHAYLFVTDGNDDHDGHGPAFHSHMHRINKATGTNISVYHSFHDEVALYKQHWWKCNGPCVSRKPFYGLVKRSMNRAPGPNDLWWKDHQSSCGGSFVKIKEPEGYGQKKKGEGKKPSNAGVAASATAKGQRDIRSLFDKTNIKTGGSPSKSQKGKGHASVKGSSSKSVVGRGSPVKGGGGGRGNIFGFGGTSFGSSDGSSLQTKGKTGSFVVNPGWKAKDNSSPGHVLNGNTASIPTARTSIKSSENVRASVRDIWSKKFPPPGQQQQQQTVEVVNLASPPQGSLSSSTLCPVCDKRVPKSTINSHLDECLSMAALSQDEEGDAKSSLGSSFKTNQSRKRANPFMDDDDFVSL